jgi:glycosyltransferase involved in cell wall biosynthesis
MPANPIVSIIVPTRNSAATLEACLKSIQAQTYREHEIIVVDRDSTDDTVAVARKFTGQVFNHSPERSAQRNFGAGTASGQFLLFVDSDMELSPNVVVECVLAFRHHPELAAVNIPETSFGRGLWARAKALERSYYQGIPWMESPRFMTKAAFDQAGGYNEHIAGGEDWELTQRLTRLGPIGRVQAPIRHNEGHLRLRDLIKKRRYYAGGFSQVYNSRRSGPVRDALRMYGLFLSHPDKTLTHPLTWLTMMFMKTVELSASGLGYASAKKSAPGQ